MDPLRNFHLLVLCIALLSYQRTEAACLSKMIEDLKAFGSQKVTKYESLPQEMQLTLELRDVFAPMVKEVVDRISKLGPSEISGGIKIANAEGIYVARAQYNKRIATDFKTPASAENVAADLHFNHAYLDERFAKYPGTYQGEADFNAKFEAFETMLPKETSDYKKVEKIGFSLGAWTSVNPIGEYGSDLSRSLLYTHEIMKREILRALEADSSKVFTAHKELLQTHTARGAKDKELGPLATVLEGLTSTNTAISLLLSNRIPGIDNYRDVVRKLILPKKGFESLLTEFSGRLPFSLSGPANFTGRYYPHPVINTDRGLELAPEFKITLTRMRHLQQAGIKNNPEQKLQGLGVGCPIFHNKHCADDMSGMQTLFEAYLRVFEKVDDELHRSESR